MEVVHDKGKGKIVQDVSMTEDEEDDDEEDEEEEEEEEDEEDEEMAEVRPLLFLSAYMRAPSQRRALLTPAVFSCRKNLSTRLTPRSSSPAAPVVSASTTPLQRPSPRLA